VYYKVYCNRFFITVAFCFDASSWKWKKKLVNS